VIRGDWRKARWQHIAALGDDRIVDACSLPRFGIGALYRGGGDFS